MTYYKVLNEDGSCSHGGDGKWYLPNGSCPGKWMPKVTGELVPCQHGYHVCREEDLIHWLGPTIWEVEPKGVILTHENKVVVREARLLRALDTWDERTARLFAADCAEHVLHLFEEVNPNDDRPRKAIEAARQYANGQITTAAGAAAGDAAWAAVRAAAWTAAGDAARAKQRARFVEMVAAVFGSAPSDGSPAQEK